MRSSRAAQSPRTILIVVIVVIAAAALFWFFAPPDLKARLGLAAAGTPLRLVDDAYGSPAARKRERAPDRYRPGHQSVRPRSRTFLRFRRSSDRPERSSTAGRSSLRRARFAAGASASFNSAEVNVPPGGDELTITLGEPNA